MNHFKFQSLVFYGVAIGSVLLLFKVVTAYGESSLRAPAAIDGRYRLALSESLPNCLQSEDLLLTIQQSGIYFNGYLSPINQSQQSSEEKPSLSGILQNQQLNLSGTVASSILCPNSTTQTTNRTTQVRIQSQVQKEELAGRLSLDTTPTAIEFTAPREVPAQQSETPSTH